jgi:uncharacterized membrane protein (DUF4010 family)
MPLTSALTNLAIAFGLGLLVGLQRESVASQLGGLRTFPLITIFGTLCAMLAQSSGGWVIGAGVVALAGMIVIGNIAEFKSGRFKPGMTTEIAMLLMFGVGAYLVGGHRVVAIIVGSGTAILLHFKGELHDISKKLGGKDIRAIMQFALISLVVLPILPDRTYGPYSVLNPRNIWIMVALIVGISLAGYIVYKFFGQNSGIILGGILGGLISSTATTVSYARRSARDASEVHPATTVVMIASTILYARLLVEIATVSPRLFNVALRPILALLLLMALLSFLVWFRGHRDQMVSPLHENPTELKSAFIFGALYGLILLAVAAVKDRFGSGALYLVAILSGLTDVDAITLSISQLVNVERMVPDQGWRVIVLASLANLAFKGAVIGAIGHPRLLLRMSLLFGATFSFGMLILLFWPNSN